MLLKIIVIVAATFALAEGRVGNSGTYCNYNQYFKVVTAEIINFPPITNKLNTFLNTTVLSHVSVDIFELQLIGSSGYTSQSSQNLNVPVIPGNHFHINSTINIDAPGNETYILKMILSNPVEQAFCYQINFGIWSLK